MNIGRFRIYPIETGFFALDGGAMFGVVPKNLWQKQNPPDDQNRIKLAMRALLLKSRDRNILIDCGIGNKFEKKWSDIYKIDFSEFNLHNSLAETGVNAEEITDLIISHLHFDHTGGATYFHDGELRLTFPNARYFVQEKQWNWAVNPSSKDRASFLKDNFLLLQTSGRLTLLNDGKSPFPDSSLYIMNGHTPGMQLVLIQDSHSSLLYCADLIPTRSHIPLPWVMAYDNYPLRTIREKKRILQSAYKYNWLLFLEHDPQFSAAYVNYHPEKGYFAGTSYNKSDFNAL
jgi:glyoxylase-like metal-dependent hydrolase (beta-lactamase superfamily II)